jgi:hypothetical protein
MIVFAVHLVARFILAKYVFVYDHPQNCRRNMNLPGWHYKQSRRHLERAWIGIVLHRCDLRFFQIYLMPDIDREHPRGYCSNQFPMLSARHKGSDFGRILFVSFLESPISHLYSARRKDVIKIRQNRFCVQCAEMWTRCRTYSEFLKWRDAPVGKLLNVNSRDSVDLFNFKIITLIVYSVRSCTFYVPSIFFTKS